MAESIKRLKDKPAPKLAPLPEEQDVYDIRYMQRAASRRNRTPDDAWWGMQVEAEAEGAADELIDDNLPSLTEMAYGLATPEGSMIAKFSGPNDSRTCGLCRSLIGMKCRVDSEEYAMYSPPLHNRCRHYWNYLEPTSKGANVAFVHPDPALVKRHGHLISKPNPDAELKIPATPSNRDFVIEKDANGKKHVRFAPDPQLEAEARRTLRRLNRELASGEAKGMTRTAYDLWAAQPNIQELERKGMLKTSWTWGSERRAYLHAPDRTALDELLSTHGNWLQRQVARVEEGSATNLPGGVKGKQWVVVYRERDIANVRLTQAAQLELRGVRPAA